MMCKLNLWMTLQGPKIHYMATLDLPHWTITCGWIIRLMDFMMSVARPYMWLMELCMNP
jgi:hypothetical protein